MKPTQSSILLARSGETLFPITGNSEVELAQKLNDLALKFVEVSDFQDLAKWNIEQKQDSRFAVCLLAKAETLIQEIDFARKGVPLAFRSGRAWQTPSGSFFEPNPVGKEAKVALVYSGAASAYLGLGKDIFQLFPHLLQNFGEMVADVEGVLMTQKLYPRLQNSEINLQNPNLKNHSDTIKRQYRFDTLSQMAIGSAFSAIFTKVVMNELQIKPSMALGYSMGEASTMWYALGVWSAKNLDSIFKSSVFTNRMAGEMQILQEYWQMPFEEVRKRWTSVALVAPAETVKMAVDKHNSLNTNILQKIYLTFINTPFETIISGDKETCLAFAESLGVQHKEVKINNVTHHEFVRKDYDEIYQMHLQNLQKIPNLDFYGGSNYGVLEMKSEKIAQNSAELCCNQVNFWQNIEKVYQDGARIFIEVGANAFCTRWIDEILKNRPHLAVATNRKGVSDLNNLLSMMARLVSHHIPLNINLLYKNMDIKNSRSLAKQITLGGIRAFETLITEENLQKFQVSQKIVREDTNKGGENLQKFQVFQKIVREDTNKGGVPSALAEEQNKERNNISQRNVISELALTEEQNNEVRLKPNLQTEKIATMNNIEITSPKTLSYEEFLAIPEEKQLLPTANLVVKEENARKIAENGLELQNYGDPNRLNDRNVIWDENDLKEFAYGKIAKVFGEEYSIIDTYSRRVMLPKDPYLLVSRITGLQGKMGEYKPSKMVTEYDIPYGSWFATDGQIPWAVAVESGQCDLMLISYLGIDFANKGELVYRLLDCTLFFMDDLPFEGQTLRYEISINSFAKSGRNLLFFFSYDCFVEDRMVLKMRGGCAGFFADEELAQGQGVVYTKEEIAKKQQAVPRRFVPVLDCEKRIFEREDLLHLVAGEPEKCFGEVYGMNGRNPSLRMTTERILMIDRIAELDPQGGAWGLGLVLAEKDLEPNDWYFPCHFRDDEVLAGSLQAEGGGQLLKFFMLFLGMQNLVKDARFQPIPDLPQKVRCRKEIPASKGKLIYKLEVKEIGLLPSPYIVADLEIIYNGKVAVCFENLGLLLREKNTPYYKQLSDAKYGTIPVPNWRHEIRQKPENVLLTEQHISEFALGSIVTAFGEEFEPADKGRASRQPNTDLQLISRVLRLEGEKGVFKNKPTLYSEYDVPANAWYFEQNHAPVMPYSVLMEIALQPCGLLGAYLGATLQVKGKELFFRNLDGHGIMREVFDLRGKTIDHKAVLTAHTLLGETIILKYDFEMACEGKVFYTGFASFGFFTEQALSAQIGLDNGQPVAAWFEQQNILTYKRFDLGLPIVKKMFYSPKPEKPHYRLATNQLDLVHELKIIDNGGKYGKGYVHGLKAVHPSDWFFTCHFYQDPVMPGSLGVEAVFQAIQAYCVQQGIGKDLRNPVFQMIPNHKISWKYRGQILRPNRNMQLEFHVKDLQQTANEVIIRGEAYVWNGNIRIYEIQDIGFRIVG